MISSGPLRSVWRRAVAPSAGNVTPRSIVILCALCLAPRLSPNGSIVIRSGEVHCDLGGSIKIRGAVLCVGSPLSRMGPVRSIRGGPLRSRRVHRDPRGCGIFVLVPRVVHCDPRGSGVCITVHIQSGPPDVTDNWGRIAIVQGVCCGLRQQSKRSL